MKEALPIEGLLFDFIDKYKLLFFPEKWNHTFLDYSKNEIFALLFVYRNGTVTMSEIAQYIDVPLNTATGIVGRLEKRGVVSRQRVAADKRVVTVSITTEGTELISNEFDSIRRYYIKIMDSISEEEKHLLLKLIAKILELLSNDVSQNETSRHKNKKLRRIIIE